MNIWIVNPFDNLPSEGNRPQRYWLMAEAFVRAGHRVVYWTSDFSHAHKAKRVPKNEDAVGNGIEVIQIPTLPYAKNVCWARVKSHRRLAKDFGKMVRERIGRVERGGHVDIVIASTPPLGLCAAAMRVAKSCGAKFVCDIQDAWPETFARLLPRSFKWTGGLLLAPMYRTARMLYREADLVTGVCVRYAKLSGRSDFYLSYHGIDGGESARCVREEVKGKKRLVYIGNLGSGYDLETVVEALARRKDLTLDIAGKGPRESGLMQKVDVLQLNERVRFHGYLDSASLAALMAHCDVGVIPMRDDSWVGLPYKLTDYLKAGLRIISSLHGECGALLNRTQFGRTYDWGSIASLLAAVDSLPDIAVSLPEELRAESIYQKYVARTLSLI